MSRVRSTSEVNTKNYFQELESILDKYQLKNRPELIWNVDETGITPDHTPPKIVASKGEKPYIITAGRSATTTVIAAGNALGETIPPYIIYKGQRLTEEITKGCLPQTKYVTTPNGWSTSETFQDFIVNHFIKHVQARPCLLLYDGHSTHITVDLIQKAQENNIHMFVLPPHSSHQLQPLDVGIFSPFKAALSTECHKLSHTQIGRQVTRQDLPGLIGNAYKSALTVPNLMSAFRKTGIVPFNPDTILAKPIDSPYKEEPSSRKERANVRTIKLLLTDIDEKVKSSLNTTQEKKRGYIIPTCGAAITESEFLEKLKESKLPENKTPKAVTVKSLAKPDKKESNPKGKVSKSAQNDSKASQSVPKAAKKIPQVDETADVIIKRGNKRPIKRKILTDFQVEPVIRKSTNGNPQKEPKSYKKQKVSDTSVENKTNIIHPNISKNNKTNKENCAPDVIDSQEAGPSNNNRKAWLTFYPSDTDDSTENDDDKCIICNLISPPEFDKQVRQARTVAFLKWGKCDDCLGWVHLKYCSSVTEIEAGVPFKCKNCDLN